MRQAPSANTRTAINNSMVQVHRLTEFDLGAVSPLWTDFQRLRTHTSGLNRCTKQKAFQSPKASTVALYTSKMDAHVCVHVLVGFYEPSVTKCELASPVEGVIPVVSGQELTSRATRQLLSRRLTGELYATKLPMILWEFPLEVNAQWKHPQQHGHADIHTCIPSIDLEI